MKAEKNLIGFNIGPIYEVMKHSKKTRELWFGSYLFSMLIKMVYDKLDKTIYTVIKPSYLENGEEKITAGLFPDRIVATTSKNKDDVLNELRGIAEDVESKFVNIISNLIAREEKSHKSGRISKNSVETIVKEYLQLDYLVFPQNEIADKDIIKEVESHLDAIEVNRSFTLGKNEPTCYRCKTLPSVITVNEWENERRIEQKLCPFCYIKLRSHNSKEIQELTGIAEQKPFPPLAQIAATELKGKFENLFEEYVDKDEQLIFENPGIQDDLKDYHKYYALFMADGDNLSKLSKHLKSPDELSKYLFEFGRSVHKISKEEFKGEPIYIGGDDIFAIMPFAFKDEKEIKTVFDFAIRINEEYNNVVAQKIQAGDDKTSLSIGITIAYHKFPLAMAMEAAYKQLFEIAKEIENKNGIAVQFIQHSGAESKFKSRFDDPLLSAYIELYKSVLNMGKGFPAVHHKIDKYKMLLSNIDNENQLENLLDKRFYEGFKDEDQQELFAALMKTALVKFLKGKEAVEELDRVSDMLHLLKFIKGDK